MSIASRITEIETHIGNAYTSIDNLGIDISNTNKNIYNISTLLDTFYERLPKVSGIGASLSLSPSMVGKIKLNEIQGDTLQNGTPTPSSPVPIQSVTGLQNVSIFKNINNQGIRLGLYQIVDGNYASPSGANRYSTTNDLLQVQPNTTYTVTTKNNINAQFYELEYNSSKTYLNVNSSSNQSVKSYTFTTGENTYYIAIDIRAYDTTNYDVSYVGDILIYDNADSNTYEVNLGNIELNKIGDYEDSIKKSTGKNLFNATLDRYATNRVRTNVYSVLPNTTYTISVGTSGISVVNYYKDINQSDISDSGLKSMPYTFTTPSNCYYIQQIIRKSDDSAITLDELSTIMLNEGSTALPYEPYGKVWYKTKNAGKTQLSSNWNWGTQGTTNFQVTLTGVNKLGLAISSTGLSNYFRVSNTGSGIYLFPILQSGTDYLRVVNATDNWETTTDFKTWLANNNVELIYPLANPEYEVITNTELINQLETLYNAKSEDGTTNINVTSEDLSMILNVGVLKGDVE